MELKPGYKQTEVGVIPEDWAALPARDIGTFKGGSGFPLTAQGEGIGAYPFFKVSDMNNEGNGTFMVTANHYVSEATRKRLGATAFPTGAIVFAKVGAAIFLERKKVLTQPSCIDNNMAALVLDKTRADVRYVHSLLLSKKLGALVATTALPALNGKQLGEMVLAIPPLPEQRAIAAALSDVDELLAGLDRLIAKKRDLKQAAMQQLLTGQTRLPGFSGAWEVKRLGDISEISMGRTPPRLNPALWGRGYTWLSIGDLLSKVVSESKEEITALAASAMTLIPKGTLLMSFKLSIGRLCFAGRDLFTNEAICAFSKLRANPEYLYYALSRIDFSLYGKQAVKGYTLNKASLNDVEVRLPSTTEQIAIAAVLSDTDAELAVLQARREKTRALKWAMMRELLTGRTRLV